MAVTKFFLKEPTSKNDTMVYLFFAYNNQRLKYYTREKINPKFWNPETNRARETKQFVDYDDFNTTLNNLDNRVKKLYRDLINDSIEPTNERLKAGLDKYTYKKEGGNPKDFLSFIEEIIASSNKRPNTIKHYKQTLKQLKEFKSSTKTELMFSAIDLNFYDKFIRYCVNKNYGTNTIGGLIKNIKVFMNEAFDRKLTTNTEFKNRKFKTIEEETENIYLTKPEIEKIYSLDLSTNPRLDKVRDMFIIGCYTGLRYSDLIRLTEQNLIDNQTKLKIKTEKTNESVIIPLHPFIKNILDKYKGFPEYNISNQKMNEYLKELGQTADLNEKVVISTTKGGQKQSFEFKKHEIITVHTARRSFATNAFMMNIPSISIMKITGHRTEKAFLKYIKISQSENAGKLSVHPFFN